MSRNLVVTYKGTVSIKMPEIDPALVKDKVACSFRMLKDRAFDRSQVVYIRSSLCLSRGQLWNVDKGL